MKHLERYLDFFSLLKEQASDKIYKRPKDPYEYKVEDDNWLSRRKGTDKWYSITGSDFKPGYQKSIDLLDKEFPDARSKEAPKRGGKSTDPKVEPPKEVEYTRDNGETATGTIVSVDKEKETVTIKADSGKEFEKPFDKVEVSDDELKKIADNPPPAETKKEEKPSEEKKESEKPNYSVKIRFVGSDWEVQIYNNDRLIDTQKFDGKNFNEESIKKQLQEIGRSTGFLEYDPADETGKGRGIVSDAIPQPDFTLLKGGVEKEKQNNPSLLLKTLGDKPPVRLKGFFLADEKTKNFIKQKSTLSDEGLTYVYPSPQNLQNGYVYFSGYNTLIKTIWVGTQKEEDSFEGETELQDAFDSAIELKEAYDRDQSVNKGVDAQARKKSKQMDELEDSLTQSKSGSKTK